MGRGKYTEQEALDAQPEPTLEIPVARVLGPRGQHLHEVAVARSLVTDEINRRLNAEGQSWFTTLVQLPPKFRSVVWVKRGSYVVVDLAEQLTDKIGGEIAMVLMPAQVKYLKQSKQWPTQYEDMLEKIPGQSPQIPTGKEASSQVQASDCDSSSESNSDIDDFMKGGNPNRRPITQDDDDSDDSSDDE
ncbi:putative RNA-binding protein eif1ad [Coemansia sp. 'formosensis']|nr:putative RNA-binding protein eif1ad [Coemansia furcata]KAJ2811894.1 putative RNA-binding protein eif1ad [Coemansia sp. 'formosensis']